MRFGQSGWEKTNREMLGVRTRTERTKNIPALARRDQRMSPVKMRTLPFLFEHLGINRAQFNDDSRSAEGVIKEGVITVFDVTIDPKLTGGKTDTQRQLNDWMPVMQTLQLKFAMEEKEEQRRNIMKVTSHSGEWRSWDLSSVGRTGDGQASLVRSGYKELKENKLSGKD